MESASRRPSHSTAHRFVMVPALGLLAALACARPEAATSRDPASSASTTGPTTRANVALSPATVTQILDQVRRPGARATLVNVWATWCVPCRQEFPDLVRLERAHREQGLRVLFVSTDFDSLDAVKFLAEQGVDYLSLFKVGDDMSFINGLSPKWSGALPASFVYDATGRLARYWEGRADYSRFEQAVLEAMKGSATPPEENPS